LVEPSLLLTEVDEAPASACNSGSVVAPAGSEPVASADWVAPPPWM
jgi:hypothetical protein